MESLIARLLEAFERGHMSRRQLIQSLALAATAGSALTLTRAAPASAAPPVSAAPVSATPLAPGSADPAFTTRALDHISYQCEDYGRTRDFYADLMGWKVVDDDGKQEAVMKLGELDAVIIVRKAPHPFTGPVKANVDHISFAIENWNTDRVREELEKRGLKPRHDTGSGHGYDSYHIRDVNGWDLQISKRPAWPLAFGNAGS